MASHKLWVDKEKIINIQLIGSHDKENAESIIEEINELISKNPNCLILIDMDKIVRPTSQARKLHAQNMRLQANYFKKTAIYGGNTLNRVIANFIIKASGRGDKVKYFRTRENAIEWLKEK